MITHVDDDEMRAGLAGTRLYTMVLLYAGPNYGTPDSRPIIWEHGRRNFGLRADGVLNVVCPVQDDTQVCGLQIFDLDAKAADALMVEDPAIVAGILTYTVHPVRGFPGDALAG